MPVKKIYKDGKFRRESARKFKGEVVRTCWDLYARLHKEAAGKKVRPKDGIAAAEKLGIAFYTARTQWSKWDIARRRDELSASTSAARLKLAAARMR